MTGMDVAAILLGTGRLSWDRGERIGDRYGTVALMVDDGPRPPCAPLDTAPVGTHGTLTAVVTETRESTHIGDIFRGIFPTTPDVGDVIELGTGTLFCEPEEDGWGPTVGLQPDDGRSTDWLDPKALYRCHEQTVDLYFTPRTKDHPDG